MGLNVDDIAKTFKIVATCLDVGLPGLVLFANHKTARAKKKLAEGGIVVAVATA